MPSKLGPALNQKVYPGAGDVDDCWVVATIQAKGGISPNVPGKPSITTFRNLAGVPDKPGSTGGTRRDVYNGAHACWEKDPTFAIPYAPIKWEDTLVLLKLGATLSVAVRSGDLPPEYRYGFDGLHQVSLDWADGKLWIVNPLQPEGSPPKQITGAAVAKAAYSFYHDNKLWGVMFVPAPKPVPPPPPVPPLDPNAAEIIRLNALVKATQDLVKVRDTELKAAQDLATHTKAEFDLYVAAEQNSDKQISDTIVAEAKKLLL